MTRLKQSWTLGTVRRPFLHEKSSPGTGGAFHCGNMNQALLDFSNIRRSGALGPGDHFEAYPITLGQRFETLGLDGGMMHKYVLATVLLDKAKTLRIIEPLYFSFKHLYCSFVLGSSREPLNYAE
jgi:hypothetical protein